jgi:hypothetical protein
MIGGKRVFTRQQQGCASLARARLSSGPISQKSILRPAEWPEATTARHTQASLILASPHCSYSILIA